MTFSSKAVLRAAVILASVLAGASGCSSDASSGGASGAPDAPSSSSKAQLRFKNTTGGTWESHVAAGHAGVTSFSYRIVLGAVPIPVRFDLSTLADGAATDYQAVDASTYADKDVLHEWSYNYNQGSGSSYSGGSVDQQVYGRLGVDLTLAADHYYTVELGPSTSTLVQDP